MKTTLLAAVLLLAAAGATAQAVNTKVDLEGHPSVSDRAETTTTKEADAPAPPVRRLRIPSQRAAAINVKEAERRLALAQHKRQEGLEPLPGELNPETGQPNFRYWKRQEKLRQDVEVAQRRVIATRQPRVAGSLKQSQQSASSKPSQM
jgi:hypothetical protein